MKIVSRAEFQKIEKCIFSKYSPQIIGPVFIKHGVCQGDDFYSSRLFGEIETVSSEDLFDKMTEMEKGESFYMSLNEICRDGMYDDEYFVVYEREDLKTVIICLEKLL